MSFMFKQSMGHKRKSYSQVCFFISVAWEDCVVSYKSRIRPWICKMIFSILYIVIYVKTYVNTDFV